MPKQPLPPNKVVSKLPIPNKPQTPPAAQQTAQNELDVILQRAQYTPDSLTPHDMVRLQRMIGNQAVHQLFTQTAIKAPTIQPYQDTRIPPVQTTLAKSKTLPIGEIIQAKFPPEISGIEEKEGKQIKLWCAQYFFQHPIIREIFEDEKVDVRISRDDSLEAKGHTDTEQTDEGRESQIRFHIRYNGLHKENTDDLRATLLHEFVLHAVPEYNKIRKERPLPQPEGEGLLGINFEANTEHNYALGWKSMIQVALKMDQDWGLLANIAKDIHTHHDLDPGEFPPEILEAAKAIERKDIMWLTAHGYNQEAEYPLPDGG